MRIMILSALVVGSVFPMSVSPPPPGGSPLATVWDQFGRGPRPEHDSSDVLSDGMGDVLWRAAHAHRPLEGVVGEVAGRYGIGRDTAADLVEATLVTHALPDRYSRTGPAEAEANRAASALWRAFRREPAASIVVHQAAWILFEIEDDPAQLRRALDELAKSPDPAPLADRIAWVVLGGADTARAAVAIALERRSSHPALLLTAAGLHDGDPCASAAWAREALKSAATSGVTDAKFLATARNRLLAALLGAGLNRDAIDAFSSVPTGEVDAALAGGPERAHGSVAGLEYEIPVLQLRSAAAAAAFLVDERDLARRIAAGPKVPPRAASNGRDVEPERLALVRSAIRRLTGETLEDPFDTLDRAIVADDAPEGGQLLSTTLLFARLARETGYPEIADAFLDSRNEPASDAAAPPDRVAKEIDACRARVSQGAADVARLRSDAAASDPAASVIARRLAAAPLNVYTEHPLPANVERWEPPEAERKKLEASLQERKIAGLWAVRVEQTGASVIAIGLSQDYDPAGEVSGGGYWIVRSRDGGRTWSRALYTGLRPMQPYVIRSFSHLPLAAGDRVHIEVDLRELDATKITFPPIARSFRRERTGLFLDVAWADLERDSDADGLTDLAEERLMTDPLAADSDGDGLPDGADPLPHVPYSRHASPQAAAIAAVLQAATSGRLQPIFPGDPGGQGPASPDLESPALHALALTSEETIFLEADRRVFAGLSFDRRVVVLSHAELESAQERFGPFFPGTLRLYVDHSGTRALAIWSESWRGMTLRLRMEGGAWKTTVVGSWIT